MVKNNNNKELKTYNKPRENFEDFEPGNNWLGYNITLLKYA